MMLSTPDTENINNETILQVLDVHKSYHPGSLPVTVLTGVDISVKRGEWVAILGASGSGKTTLLNILGTLESPDKGTLLYDETDYNSMSNSEKADFRAKKIGFVFQSYHMFPELSVMENVKLPAMINKENNASSKARAAELLEQVGLGHRKHHKSTELSGGELQRAAIARALINSPDLLLADEPTGNLDSNTGRQILDIFKNLHNSKSGRTIIMITHDMSVADYADRKIMLKDGRIEDAL